MRCEQAEQGLVTSRAAADEAVAELGAERIRADEAGTAVRTVQEERDRALAERDTARSEAAQLDTAAAHLRQQVEALLESVRTQDKPANLAELGEDADAKV